MGIIFYYVAIYLFSTGTMATLLVVIAKTMVAVVWYVVLRFTLVMVICALCLSACLQH